MSEYRTIALPKEIVEIIEDLIEEHRELGYRSVPEFVKECIRRRLEDFEEFLAKQKEREEAGS